MSPPPAALAPGTLNDVTVINPGNLSGRCRRAGSPTSSTCRRRTSSTPTSRRSSATAITAGCGDGNYCRGAPVTRAQMAVFLLSRSTVRPTCRRPAPARFFADVACPSLFADWIEQLCRRGHHGGCGGAQLLSRRLGDARADGGVPAEDRARVGLRAARLRRQRDLRSTCPARASTRTGSSSSRPKASRRAAAEATTARRARS